jgi:hypothetical protein
MAKSDGSSLCTRSSNLPYRQQQLFTLLSTLIAPRAELGQQPLCRLVVDSRLVWSLMPVADGDNWLYLAEPGVLQQVGDCLLVTAH